MPVVVGGWRKGGGDSVRSRSGVIATKAALLLRGVRREVKLSVNGISRGLNKAPVKFRDIMVMEKVQRT